MRFLQFLATSFLFLSTLLAQPGRITVNQGYLSRNPIVGGKAHIWAQQNTATQVFAAWTGDTQYLLDPQAPYTTLTVPNAEVRLTATYRTVPAWTVRTDTWNNIPVSYYIPPNPVGLVFNFHGTGGSGAALYTSTEFLSFHRDLVAAGFGVAAFDCQNRTTMQWDTNTAGASNPDIVRLNGILAAMRAQGVISADLPLFAFGQSNGGQFSHFSAPVMNWAAVSISAVQGSTPASATYSGPVQWWMPKNDDHPQVGLVGGIATSVARYEQIANRGLFARHIIQEAMPLFPERFARAINLTMADSLEVYGILRARGWLDANDFLLNNPSEIDYAAALPARFTPAMRTAVGTQLMGTYMTHLFTNFTPHLTIDLFLRAINRRPAIRPVSGASFTGANLAPSSIATIFSTALASGLEIASSGPQVNLGGVSAVLRSTTGAAGTAATETPVPWFFVSPGQGSFLVPSGLPAANMALKLTFGDRRVSYPTTIAPTSPGVFTANGNGQGVPAAVILRVAPDNTRTTEFPFVAGSAGFDAAPIRFGQDRLFLDLYMTGVRGSNSVSINIEGETITPLFAGAQPQFIGLDQVTFELPRSLAGTGRRSVIVTAGGVASNRVELNFAN